MIKIRILAFGLILFASCTNENKLELSYIKEGNIFKEKIVIDNYIDEENRIRTGYIDSLTFLLLILFCSKRIIPIK